MAPQPQISSSRDNSKVAPKGRLRSLLAALALPAEDWAEYSESRRLRPAPALIWAALVALLASTTVAVLALRGRADAAGWITSILLLSAVSAAFLLGAVHRIERRLLQPMRRLHAWAMTMCEGNLGARIEAPEGGDFAKLTHHINRLSAALERLANEMDDTVWSQTETLRQKNRALETLYDFAASIHTATDRDDLLDRSAVRLMEIVSAEGATIRLRTGDGGMRLAKHIGLGEADDGMPVDGNAFTELESLITHTPHESSAQGAGEMGLVTIPLRYQDRNLGICNLFTRQPELAEGAEMRQLLVSVGEHLGMAIEKFRLDDSARNLAIIQERTALAHELHDSLAQTLVSLRFQVRMLADTLAGDNQNRARHEVLRINESLDVANTELRELLANFRAPVDERGLLPAIADLVAQFQSESGIAGYFQSECPHVRFPMATEIQILRIVREALANARKHSHAGVVRVLVRREDNDSYRILIEDDGVGIAPGRETSAPGEHIGLSIMRERASQIGGRLEIDSDMGEGARVELTFSATPKVAPPNTAVA